MTKRKTTKKTNRKRTIKRKDGNVEVVESGAVKVITTIIAIFCTVFIALSNFSMCGGIGDIVRNVVLSTFGTFGYFFPIVMAIAILINLVVVGRSSNVKIYALLIFYVALICFVEINVHNFEIEKDLIECVSVSITNARETFSNNYTGGIIGSAFGYILCKTIGKVGSMIFFAMVGIISLILIFGLSIAKFIINVIKGIVGFVPNLIENLSKRREEDKLIQIDNENILRETVEKSRKINSGEYVNNNLSQYSDMQDDKLLQEMYRKPKKTFDTTNINITAKDVQSRFFKASETEEIAGNDIGMKEDKSKIDKEKEKLLNEMKKKSINEIMYKNKDLKASSFFYTEGMKPIIEIERENKVFSGNVDISDNESIYNDNNDITKHTENNYDKNNYNNNDYNENEKLDTENQYNETHFASGLNDIKDDDRATYDNTATTDEILNGDKDIVINAYTDNYNRNDKYNVDNVIDIENTVKADNITGIENRHRVVKKVKKYKFPPVSYLEKSVRVEQEDNAKLKEKADLLVETLKQFGVGVTLTDITVGPSITRYEFKPDLGVKVSKILSLQDDIKLAIAASNLRIEAPIPGKSAIGIEVQNEKSSGVLLGDIISSNEFRNATSKLTVAIGKDISGRIITTDLRKMPHLLIAGSTGSGKSVCINALITSLIYKSSPKDCRLIMVDPKVVELQVYNGIPHLLIPVVTDPKKAATALNWAVSEMTRRYNLIQEKKVRDIESYNQAIEGEISNIDVNDDNEAELKTLEKMPYIVIIIDEFADLMTVASKDVENSIQRIAQLARACGIYLVIATQRPDVKVISGNIKINVPSRIAFAVSSGIDSQTILDRRGAEKLLGKGDMLYFPTGLPEPLRVQGCFVSEEEIIKVVDFVKDSGVEYDESAESIIDRGGSSGGSSNSGSGEKDDKFVEAGKLIIERQSASIGMLQRHFQMGFNRAARVIDQLEEAGVISSQDGKKPREVLMTIEEFNDKFA